MWWYLILAYFVILFIRFHVDLAKNTTRMKEHHVSLFPNIHEMAQRRRMAIKGT